MLTLRTFGFGKDLTSDQNNFLKHLAHMDEPHAGFFQMLANQIVKALGPEEGAKFSGNILQNRYELQKDLNGVFDPKLFVFHLTSAVLDAVSYTIKGSAHEVLKLLENLYMPKMSEAARPRKLSNEDKIALQAQIYEDKPAKSTSVIKVEENIKRYFNIVPETVVIMLLPLYHSVVEKNKKVKGAAEFGALLFDRFFKSPILASTASNLTTEQKTLYVGQAQLLFPFTMLMNRLDSANGNFQPSKMNQQSVAVVQKLVEAHMRVVHLKTKVNKISSIFGKFLDSFKRETENSWVNVYQKVIKTLNELEISLFKNSVDKTPEQIDALLATSNAILKQLLSSVIKDPFDDLSPLLSLENDLASLQKRVNEIVETFTVIANMLEMNSPARQVFLEAINSVQTTFEESLVGLMNNVVTISLADKEEEILQCQTKLTGIVAPIMAQNIDEQTVLHLLLKHTTEDKQAHQRQLECLLREGAALQATTTKYEKKGSAIKTMMSKFLSKNAPLSAEQLAINYGNGELLSQAVKKVDAERERKDSENSEKFKAFIASSVENSRRNSTASATSQSDLEEPSLGSSGSWVRSEKRERTPGTTPRGSEEGHTDKKKREELDVASPLIAKSRNNRLS